MELIYIWIKNYRNFQNQAINITGEFGIQFDQKNKTLQVVKLDSYVKLFESPIININAIVGKNGVGKTNFLNLIGDRHSERHYNDYERYFFVYYLCENESFIIEGNYLPVLNCIRGNKNIDKQYFKNKNWYCIEVKFEYNEFKFIKNYSMKEAHIVSFRKNINKDSEENFDESKMMVQRRLVSMKSSSQVPVIKMLVNQMNIQDREMFLEDEYTLRIQYNDFFTEYYLEYLDETIDLKANEPKSHLRILNAFVLYYFRRAMLRRRIDKNEEAKCFKEIFQNRTRTKEYRQYYWDIIESINNKFLNDLIDEITHKHNKHQFEMLLNALELNEQYNTFKYFTGKEGIYDYDGYLELKLHKDTQLIQYKDMIKATIDSEMNSIQEQAGNLFNDFFDYSLFNLSGGEYVYLELLSTINEQLLDVLGYTNHYILLLDEPDQGLHPEMARNLICNLVSFLQSNINKNQKTIQIILSTHSPFLLTDLTNDRVVALEKGQDNKTKIYKIKGKTFGANIHQLLTGELFMSSTIGEYARQEINDVLRKLQSHEGILNEDIAFLIESIGEPVVRNRLQQLYDRFIDNSLNYDLEIRRLEHKVSELETKENKMKIMILKEQMKIIKKKIEDLSR